MNNIGPYIWLSVHDLSGFAAASYLIVNDHPWWAALCFLLIIVDTVKINGKD